MNADQTPKPDPKVEETPKTEPKPKSEPKVEETPKPETVDDNPNTDIAQTRSAGHMGTYQQWLDSPGGKKFIEEANKASSEPEKADEKPATETAREFRENK